MKFYLLALEGVIAAALTGASTAVAMLTPAVAAVLKLRVVTPEGWRRHERVVARVCVEGR
jgi:hypothetical protein